MHHYREKRTYVSRYFFTQCCNMCFSFCSIFSWAILASVNRPVPPQPVSQYNYFNSDCCDHTTAHTTLTITGTNTLTVTTSVPSITTGAVTTATSTISPTSSPVPSPTNSPSNGNKNDKKLVVVVVSSIAGVTILGAIVATTVVCVRKRKRAQYELIPTL